MFFLGIFNYAHLLTLHKLLIEYKKTVNGVYESEKEANTGTDDLETKLGYEMDLNLGYVLPRINDNYKKEANITYEEIESYMKEIHNSVLFRNMIAKVSIHDKTIIPQYESLIKISKQVIDEINKKTKG
jgi:hypothetical protein